MIGIVIVTHGRLAIELFSAMEQITGPQEQTAYVCIDPDDDMDKLSNDIVNAVKKTNSGSGVIILTDLLGGTPCNLSISIIERGKTEVIAGVNLPLLIKLIEIRKTKNLLKAAKDAKRAGKKNISIASELID